MSEITHILEAIDKGEATAAAKLLPLVYDELKRLASVKMAQESVDHTLQATALVHEAYLRLVGSNNTVGWDSRGHFFAASAEAMRRILIENARRKKRLRHGGGRRQIDLVDAPASEPDDRLLALDEALPRLAMEDAIAARVVELRHFAGLGHEDVAAHLPSPSIWPGKNGLMLEPRCATLWETRNELRFFSTDWRSNVALMIKR